MWQIARMAANPTGGRTHGNYARICARLRTLELPCPAGQFFLDQAKVGLNSGETFGADYAGYARLNFATPSEIRRELVARMKGGGAEAVSL
jgi:bifunctional pyridoxal-dependent enzyme with beta-cystathionase and maltose regulon repressor activities